MEILSNYKQLESYMREAYISSDRPLLVDKYLGNAVELDVDALRLVPQLPLATQHC